MGLPYKRAKNGTSIKVCVRGRLVAGAAAE